MSDVTLIGLGAMGSALANSLVISEYFSNPNMLANMSVMIATVSDSLTSRVTAAWKTFWNFRVCFVILSETVLGILVIIPILLKGGIFACWENDGGRSPP